MPKTPVLLHWIDLKQFPMRFFKDFNSVVFANRVKIIKPFFFQNGRVNIQIQMKCIVLTKIPKNYGVTISFCLCFSFFPYLVN